MAIASPLLSALQPPIPRQCTTVSPRAQDSDKRSANTTRRQLLRGCTTRPRRPHFRIRAPTASPARSATGGRLSSGLWGVSTAHATRANPKQSITGPSLLLGCRGHRQRVASPNFAPVGPVRLLEAWRASCHEECVDLISNEYRRIPWG